MSLDFHTVAETNSIEIMRHVAMLDGNITFLTPFDIEADRLAGRLVYVPIHEFARHTQRLMVVENQRKQMARIGPIGRYRNGTTSGDWSWAMSCQILPNPLCDDPCPR